MITLLTPSWRVEHPQAVATLVARDPVSLSTWAILTVVTVGSLSVVLAFALLGSILAILMVAVLLAAVDHGRSGVAAARQRVAYGCGPAQGVGGVQRGCRPEGLRPRHRPHGRHRQLRRRSRARPRADGQSRERRRCAPVPQLRLRRRGSQQPSPYSDGAAGDRRQAAAPCGHTVVARTDPRRHINGRCRCRGRCRTGRPLLGHPGSVADGSVHRCRSARRGQRRRERCGSPTASSQPEPPWWL